MLNAFYSGFHEGSLKFHPPELFSLKPLAGAKRVIMREMCPPQHDGVIMREMCPPQHHGVIMREMCPPQHDGVIMREMCPPQHDGVIMREMYPHRMMR